MALPACCVYARAGFPESSVASDLPMIEPIVVEVPNPKHPFDLKGVTEGRMVSSLGCVANAIAAVSGRRITSLPINPPKLLNAPDERGRSFDQDADRQQVCIRQDSSGWERA